MGLLTEVYGIYTNPFSGQGRKLRVQPLLGPDLWYLMM